MTRRGSGSIYRLALVAAVLGSMSAAAAAAPRNGEDALSLVPTDAASVALIRLSELRTSPLASQLFADADRMTVDGDAARFLEETHLRPATDVDTVVVAGLPPSASGRASGVAFFFGRFDPDRLAAAAVTRGALRKHSGGGEYYLLPENAGSHSGKPNAVAFVTPGLIIAGAEPSVVSALATRQSGGTGFASGNGLGRHLSRIGRDSAVWALVDVARYPTARRSIEKGEASAPSEPSAALLGAMKSVTLVAFEATPHADALELSATGLCSDEDTRSLLEDSLRGVLAMWRLATQEKAPELVSALRQFKVRRDGEGVTVSGVLPGSVVRALSEKKHPHH
jgi:hypothetical protein